MGQGRWFISTIVEDTLTPSSRERPTRLHLTNVERGNPVVVRQTGKPTVREAERRSSAQDVPRSECQQPKGTGKPAAMLSDNLLDTVQAASTRGLTLSG